MERKQITGRKLKKNHSNAIPRYIISYDAETIPEQTDSHGRRFAHKFRLAVAKSARIRGDKVTDVKTARFLRPDAFWQWALAHTGPQHTVWIVAHNALFDMIVSGLPERMERAEFLIDWPRSRYQKEDNSGDEPHSVGICCLESPPTILALRSVATQGRFVIVDSLNWFPVSLKMLGESTGLPKLPMPQFSECDETWFRYCERDVDIVFGAFTELINWVKTRDMGMFRYTAPSQAMAAYRHRFMESDIYFHDNAEVKALERESYFGGRTEVFKIGQIREVVHQLDVNSLFPSVMMRGQFPYRLDRYEITNKDTDVLPEIDYDRSVASVILETNRPLYPIRRRGRVIWPVGRFRASLAGRELCNAYKLGHIRSVASWAEYSTAALFNKWVCELWGMRREYKEAANGLYDQFTKRLLNSLYGKFAQLSPQWVNDDADVSGLPWSSWSECDMSTGERTNFRSVGWQVQRQESRQEIASTFCAISAFVTALARRRMDYLRYAAGQENCYYQGVDSLIVTDEGYRRLQVAGEVSDTELGKMRLQVSTDYGEIFGCSDYLIGDRTVVSGRAAPVEDKETGILLQKKFLTDRILFCGSPASEVIQENVTWERSTEYYKGTVSADGSVQPLTLLEL